MIRKWGFFVLGWVLILGGSFLAGAIQTDFDKVKVEDVRFPGDGGIVQSGLLYVPRDATAQRPAPAVLVSHGYINTREMQSPFAIELARRGFVVLAMDMKGHGYSEGAVKFPGDDLGGAAALRYLTSRPFVDKTKIGLEGHSMGGVPISSAAAAMPDGYKAIVYEGSTPGFLGAAKPQAFHNLAVVFGQFDEFAPLMWGVPKGSMIAGSPKLIAAFGTPGPVQEAKVYGSVADGTARVLYNPPVTHPWEHFSRAGVGGAVHWFQLTLGAPHPLEPYDQVWLWTEIGTALGFAGLILLLMGTFELLLSLPWFAQAAHPAEPLAEKRGGRWWIAALLTAAVPAATYFPLMKLGLVFFPMQLFPQYIHNQLLVWALGNAVITLVLNFVLRGGKPTFTNRWLPAAGLAAATVAVGYLSLVIVDALFKVDYRFWVLGLKPLDGRHAVMAIPYALLWGVAFLVSIRALASNLAVKGEGFWVQLSVWKVAMAAGFGVLLIWEYATLFNTGFLGTPKEPLNTIVAIQFVPLLAVVGVIAALTYRRTNSYVPGALICALLLAWYVTGGTATHWYPGFKLPTAASAPAKR
jgi:pimeloyl-ACP methyl ester carboxylesterase